MLPSPLHKPLITMQVAQRHFNAHAFLNTAILLNVQEADANGHTGFEITDAQVIFGFAKEEAGALACGPA